MRGKAIWLSASILLLACSSATVIYLTHPSDPHEGLLVGLAALLWPFIGFPVAWLVCMVVVAREWRSQGAIRTVGVVALPVGSFRSRATT